MIFTVEKQCQLIVCPKVVFLGFNFTMSQNLIDEREFAKPYNPWKRFAIFYLLAAVHIISIYVLIEHYIISLPLPLIAKQALMILIVVSPFALALLMLLGDRQLFNLSAIKSIAALFILEVVYIVSGVLISQSRRQFFSFNLLTEENKVMSIFFGVHFIIVLAIALPLLNYRKKAAIKHV
jgi:hypothetical protein